MKRKIILITGAKGLLGTALLKTAPNDYILYPTSLKSKSEKILNYKIYNLDITSYKELKSTFKNLNPDIVIHTASIGNVDICEKNRELAKKVNIKATEYIANLAQYTGAKVLFTSSNAVFDGQNAPYTEKSKTNPVNYYGKTKVKGEKIISQANSQNAIVRLILMYGWNHFQERSNPVTWLLKLLKNKQKVNLVNDTYTNPLYNIQAAQAIWMMLQLNKSGIYHVAGKDRVNRYEFGIITAKVFGLDSKLIQSVESNYFKGIATRMPDTTYNTGKMQKDLHIKPYSLHAGLTMMKKARFYHEK